MDPELQRLLGDLEPESDTPGYSEIFGEKEPVESAETGTVGGELTKDCFPPIGKLEQEPDPVFLEVDHYSKALTGVGDASNRLHTALQNFLKETDLQKKGKFRKALIDSYWEWFSQLAAVYKKNRNQHQKWVIRYGYLLPTLLTAEQRSMLAKVIEKNEYDEPVHYLDEWIELVSSRLVNPLLTDESLSSKRSSYSITQSRIEQTRGTKEASIAILQTLSVKRNELEAQLNSCVEMLLIPSPHPGIPGLNSPYSSEQQSALTRGTNTLRELNSLNQDIAIKIAKITEYDNQIEKFSSHLDDTDEVVDPNLITNEIASIRQMIKLCVGRQGNHFPFLMKSFLSSSISLIATRENVILKMDEIEKIDQGVFQRTFKRKTLRIVPHTIIVPCYGNQGLCWEAFEIYNRATSRGRIAIPMYPKDLRLAVIYALGDLRWNVAKERAAQYWMTEGLTGEYYQYFYESGGKGDVKLQFIEDYVLWITKEVNGVQKLAKETRGILWRYIPFKEEVREILRKRGYVYETLYKKDINRSISDGY